MPTFLIFIIALSLLIFFHELGHFLAAKYFGVWVYEFGLGYPPRLWGKKIGETIYSFNLLPFGGFVRLLESPEEAPPLKIWEKIKTKGRDLASKPKKARFLVMISGILMNLLLGILIFSLVYSLVGVPQKSKEVRVVQVMANSPAEKAGLAVDDLIVEIRKGGEKVKIKGSNQLVEKVNQWAGEEIVLTVKNSQGEKEVKIVPRKKPPEDQGPLGVAISDTKMIKLPWWQRPFLGIWAGFKEAVFWGEMIVSGLGKMFTDLFLAGKIPRDVAGPVGIYQTTSLIKRQSGILAVIHFFGILSVNLAVVNLIPFPALDGSYLVFLLWEGVTKKPFPARWKRTILNFGMAFLIFFLVLITIGDVRRMF